MWRDWIYLNFIRPVIKWCLRRLTGLCELQRICYGTLPGYLRTSGMERSLRLSRQAIIQRILVLEHLRETINTPGQLSAAVTAICRLKNVKEEIHPEFTRGLAISMCQIYYYETLRREVEQFRSQPYSSQDSKHEEKLLLLWDKMTAGERPLSGRITRQWQDIGFQGEDPATDFRGMGMLALENLLYLACNYTDTARQMLTHSHHPSYGYSWAIVGINVTHLALSMLNEDEEFERLLHGKKSASRTGGQSDVADGLAVSKVHFYNAHPMGMCIDEFNEFYSALFYHFDRYWIKVKPKDVMEFNHVQQQFVTSLRAKLKSNPEMILKIESPIQDL